MSLQTTISLSRNYLLSIGVGEEFIEEALDLSFFSNSLVLNLPDVCIIKANRLNGSTSNQTHIHITGDDMLNFYDSEVLDTITTSTDDEEIEVVLIDANLEHLEVIRGARRNKNVETNFRKDRKASLIESSTVKKISKRAKQSPQVQISKTRIDDEYFSNLRRSLFTNDKLIFLRYANQEDRYMVIGIPSTFEENEVELVVREQQSVLYSENNSLDSENSNTRESSLRAVDVNTIARFEVDDEDEDSEEDNYTFDLSQGIKTRKKRTERHTNIVKLVANVLMSKAFTLYEGRIDCLGIREFGLSPAVISEIKTLDGSWSDECSQVMKAFSQLFYYEEFHMGEFKNYAVQKIVVFEQKIADEHILFFEKSGILVFWVNNNELVGTENALEFLCELDII